VPGDESGRVDPRGGGDSPVRWIGRGLLLLPRVALQVAFAPVRGGIWANERYHVYDRAHALFFNDAGTMGVYPTLKLETDFGFQAGAKLVHHDLFGARERVSLSASTGGRSRARVAASLRTGHRLGRVSVALAAEYDLRPHEAFYGIGNGDELTEAPAPIDALADPSAVEARHRQELRRAAAVLDVRVAGQLHLRGAAALTDLELGRADAGPAIDELYRPASLIGWDGVRHAYTELELRWDGRRPATSWEPRPLPAAGWFAAAHVGRVTRLDGGVDFWRYGGDVQHFLRVGRGPRVLAARAHVEAVSGARHEVSLFDLPQLGGKTLLRGYPSERFRDRIAVLGSLDYVWDLSLLLSARVFTDVGRVHASARELDLDGLRVGYGVGLDVHTWTSFLLRGTIASSIDGGVFLDLSFEPVFDLDGRVEQR
jgi:hypothetical protein